MVHHICIQTNHYKDSLTFYTDILGFELIKETPNFHNRYFNTWLKLDSFYIELQTGKVGETLNSANTNTQGAIHFCLWVDDLAKEVQKIKQFGYNFIKKNGEEIYRVEGGHLCKMIAPEGTIIELRDNRGI
ncbi:VOC family protein [Bacillus sp. 31A1R]|uniref:VOC family protein n=1 Tax=Robertmurraya mangrovi TaxID=3098077 RepID=A0ABU5IZ18_9BACI|nr:VOC family protein [Bacillus sp. 31A1R]MDZ5472342.1 VOC family protein [Bacillus sp. 31A1R]